MTEDGIITTVYVKTGNKSDPKALPDFVKQTKAASVKMEEVIAERAYGTSTNLQLLQSQHIHTTIALHPNVFEMENEQRDRFTYNRCLCETNGEAAWSHTTSPVARTTRSDFQSFVSEGQLY